MRFYKAKIILSAAILIVGIFSSSAKADSTYTETFTFYGLQTNIIFSQVNSDQFGKFVPGLISVSSNTDFVSPFQFYYGNATLSNGSTCQMQPYGNPNQWRQISYLIIISDNNNNILLSSNNGRLNSEISTIGISELHIFISIPKLTQLFNCQVGNVSYTSEYNLAGFDSPLSNGGSKNQKNSIIKINKKSQEILIDKIDPKVISEKYFRLEPEASSGLNVKTVEWTPDICLYQNGLVMLKNIGSCGLKFIQSGDGTYEGAETLIYFDITNKSPNKKTTINCMKGNTIKKVSSINPKCPTGYKKV